MFKVVYLPTGEYAYSMDSDKDFCFISREAAENFLPYNQGYYYEIIEVPDV